MIKIDLKNEKSTLLFHYNNVTTQKGNEWTIQTFLNNRKRKFKNPLNQQIIDLYEYLLSKTIKDKSGFSLLTAEIQELENVRLHIERTYSVALSSEFTRDGKGKIITVRDDLLKVFFYESYNKWKAYELATKIGVKVCPYCNRNFTFIVGNDKDKGTRFQYDHFYDKATYPYLALSFYNLIPSCNVCNSDLKGSEKFTFQNNVHPYSKGFGNDLLFSIRPKSISFINGKTTAYRIRFRMNKSSKWSNGEIKAAFKNISVFKLSSLYNMHKDYVDEIIQRSIVYNQESIEDIYNRHEGDLFSSIEEVRKMIIGNYTNEEDYSKRPLAKLSNDISKELGLL